MSRAQRIYRSSYGPLDVPIDCSVAQFLETYNVDDVADDKVIMSDFYNPASTLTFGSIRKDAARGATGLVNVLNLKDEDVVCVFAFNSVNWCLLAHAVMWMGGIFAGINAAATSHELVHYFAIAKPKVIAVDPALLSRVEAALKMGKADTERPRILIVEDENGKSASPHYVSFPTDILKFTAGRPALDLSYRDNRHVPAGMCFSSGTSGQPKAVLLSHHNLIAYALTLRGSSPSIINCHQTEVFYPPFPHIYGIGTALMCPAYTGQHVVAMKRFDFEAYLRKCVEVRATIARMVPATAIQMAKDPVVRSMDLTSISTLFCAGASLPAEVADALSKQLQGVVVLNAYGMSEGAISTLKEVPSARKSGSVGKPFIGVQMRVVDDEYNDVAPGESGECLVRGPTNFMRYYGNAKATREAFRDGWLCTGDIVKVDEDGYFWLTARKKELIKYRGNQVPPAELEAVLLSYERVSDAGVCGVWSEDLQTEVPVGYVSFAGTVAAGQRDKLLQEIRTYVDERVSPFKKLRGGLFWLEAMPKNATGKLMRRELPAAKKAMAKL